MQFRRLTFQGAARSPEARARYAQNYYLLALPHIDSSDLEAARPLLRKALDADPDHQLALRAVASLEFSQGNLRQARVHLDRLLSVCTPEDADTLFLRGNIELSEGQFLAALDSYRQVEADGDATHELEFNKGLAHLMLGARRRVGGHLHPAGADAAEQRAHLGRAGVRQTPAQGLRRSHARVP